jgi:hypothetical protein
VRAREIVQKAADPPPPDDAVQPGIDVVFDRDRQFFGYSALSPYASDTYSGCGKMR